MAQAVFAPLTPRARRSRAHRDRPHEIQTSRPTPSHRRRRRQASPADGGQVRARGARRGRARAGRVRHVRLRGLQEPQGGGRIRARVGESIAPRSLYASPRRMRTPTHKPVPAPGDNRIVHRQSLTIAFFSFRSTPGLPRALPPTSASSSAAAASNPASASGASLRASWSSARPHGRAPRAKGSKSRARPSSQGRSCPCTISPGRCSSCTCPR